MSIPTLHLALFTALALTVTAAPEKPTTKEQKKPARHARILPVGDSPPFMQEVRDGVRHEIDPPAGTLPPRTLVSRVERKKENQQNPLPPASIPLNLNRISPPLVVPDGPGFLEFDRSNEKPTPAPWLRVTRPESGDFMILLWRDPKEKTWNKTTSLIVPDGPDGNPSDTVRLVNLFPQSVRILWGEEKLLVKPGNTFTRRITPGTDVAFEVLSVDSEGEQKRYFSNQITQNPGERGFITIYQADGESPRRPLKVLVFREPAVSTKVR